MEPNPKGRWATFKKKLRKENTNTYVASDQRSISDSAKIRNYMKLLYSTRPHDARLSERNFY